jgi:hypothetical protein
MIAMDLETIYSLCSAIAFAGWIALGAAPLARDRLIGFARIAALVLAAAYLIQMFTITESTGGDFTTLRGVALLFSQPGNVMLGWTHYLAFDLFVGSWIAEDAGREDFPHWALIPILFATLMVGPIGLLIWFGVRTIHRARLGKALA